MAWEMWSGKVRLTMAVIRFGDDREGEAGDGRSTIGRSFMEGTMVQKVRLTIVEI